ncbi:MULTISPECIES: hypothetical protein [Actinomadura]|uniref:Uncharacterized protein n=1 Tax=Actinomadura madurae TaxID=1993 RepID=A0A1I5MLC1_9ACTN|nr:hypothetical protein [Actinomadura madurae]SFP09746.1 hypothetical protein SAMN04489713_111318 [Actinomadura madurae]SPT60850.1 Uncharacterised protein [Actinomadura madurae]
MAPIDRLYLGALLDLLAGQGEGDRLWEAASDLIDRFLGTRTVIAGTATRRARR